MKSPRGKKREEAVFAVRVDCHSIGDHSAQRDVDNFIDHQDSHQEAAWITEEPFDVLMDGRSQVFLD